MRFLLTGRFRIFKICFLILVIILTCYLILGPDNRNRIKTYFSISCIDYDQEVFSRRLTDKVYSYSDQSKLTGIKECRDEKEILKKVSEGKLFRIRSSNRLIIDRMSYSYPYLTKESKILLGEIGKRFREKTTDAGLTGVRFIVTSMTRTTANMKKLRRNNQNASVNSAHLNGNAFDISYLRFNCRKLFVTECDKRFFKEALAQVIWQLREENKCWATYEKNQNCYHIVSR